jgi:hypothetical protein
LNLPPVFFVPFVCICLVHFVNVFSCVS